MKNLLVFYVGEFTSCSFLEKVYLSTFGFILPCCTMMFLYIFLYSSLLRFQRAQDHRKRSPEAKVMLVLVSLFRQFFKGR